MTIPTDEIVSILAALYGFDIRGLNDSSSHPFALLGGVSDTVVLIKAGSSRLIRN